MTARPLQFMCGLGRERMSFHRVTPYWNWPMESSRMPIARSLRCGSCCRCASVSVAGGRENSRRPVRRRVCSAPPNCVLRNGRQRTSVLAEARARFEAGDADSCGAPAERRRGSEEELRGGEALDNLHGSSAKRTLPRRVNGPRGRGGACYWLSGWLEQPQTKRKEFCSPPVKRGSRSCGCA